MTRSLPPVVVTGSRLLRAELHVVEQHCGLDFDYHDTLTAARSYAVRREAIVLGADLVGRVRRPWRCRGTAVVATLNPVNSRLLQFGARAGAAYTIQLPTGRPVLIDVIRRAHHAHTTPATARQ